MPRNNINYTTKNQCNIPCNTNTPHTDICNVAVTISSHHRRAVAEPDWTLRACPACARLQLYSSKIAKITNFTLLRAPRLRKYRSIDFRNLFTILFGYSSRKKLVVARICALPSVDAIAVTIVPKLAFLH